MERRTEEAEIVHYNQVAAASVGHRAQHLASLSRFVSLGGRLGEPSPDAWLDSTFDCLAQRDVTSHLAPVAVGGDVVQVGGSGVAAVRFLLGGARSATLVTPAAGETELARWLANELGVGERFTGTVGFGEELPLKSGSVDAVISEACLHHMEVGAALRDFHRVLRPGGRFGAWDPWKARLYTLGISIFGKRDPDVDCRPLEPSRIAELSTIFPDSYVNLHGAITRYPALAANKMGLPVSLGAMRRAMEIDDRISSRFRVLQRNGSSVAVLGVK